jgi:hypothetical protein
VIQFFSFLTAVQKSKDLCSVTVGGEEIPNMPPEMQLKVIGNFLKLHPAESLFLFCFVLKTALKTLISAGHGGIYLEPRHMGG